MEVQMRDEKKRLVRELQMLNTTFCNIIASLDALSKFLDADHGAQVQFINTDLRTVLTRYKKIAKEMGEELKHTEQNQ